MQEVNCSCGHLAVVGPQCRTCYQRDYRKRKKNGEGALYARGITVTCGRADCANLVRINGSRRKMFEETGKGAYCSRECQTEATQIEVDCAGCGAKLMRYRQQVEKSSTGRFICEDCKAAGVGCKPRKGNEHACEGCGVTFYRRPGDETARFHSRACRAKHEQEQRVTLTCEYCGVKFETIKAHADRGRRYCDWQCKTLAGTTNAIPGEWHNGKPKVHGTDDPDGYVMIWEPEHPRAFHGGWVLEHRWVMEQQLGRYLETKEQVDHINQIKNDNRPENLRVLDPRTHQRVTAANAKINRAAARAELARYRELFGSVAEAAEAALRADGYRPVGEMLEEARGILMEAVADPAVTLSEDQLALLQKIVASHRKLGGRKRHAPPIPSSD